MVISGHMICLALSVFPAPGEFSGKASIIVHWSCNVGCLCYEERIAP